MLIEQIPEDERKTEGGGPSLSNSLFWNWEEEGSAEQFLSVSKFWPVFCLEQRKTFDLMRWEDGKQRRNWRWLQEDEAFLVRSLNTIF